MISTDAVYRQLARRWPSDELAERYQAAYERGADVLGELITTIDATATGSLHRSHLALQSDGESRGYDAEEWLPLAYEQAADWLQYASAPADPPSLIEHAQQAGRFAALAIGSLDRDAPTVPEAITDSLAHLLVACVFADVAGSRRGG